MSLLSKILKASDLNSLVEAVDKLEQKSYKDESELFWKPVADKSKAGSFVIRFLPVPEIDLEKGGQAWVGPIFNHGFQHPEKNAKSDPWFIDNCPTTIGKPCPVCEHNSVLYNSGSDYNKEIVKKQKRQVKYLVNILVVKDTKNPENNGKVFLFSIGTKLFNKILQASKPVFEDEKPFNPFCPVTGKDFNLKFYEENGQRTYDKSAFVENSTRIAKTDEEIEAILSQEHSLLQFLDESRFKDYDTLRQRLARVVGTVLHPDNETKVETPKVQQKENPVPSKEVKQTNETKEDGDDIDYFQSFLEDD